VVLISHLLHDKSILTSAGFNYLCNESQYLFDHRIMNALQLEDNRDGIRKHTLSLGFLGIISRVLRLEVSTLVFAFLQTSLIDCFAQISETIGGLWFSVRFFCFVYTNKFCLFIKIIFHVQTL
jgi:hypothetical protein